MAGRCLSPGPGWAVSLCHSGQRPASLLGRVSTSVKWGGGGLGPQWPPGLQSASGRLPSECWEPRSLLTKLAMPLQGSGGTGAAGGGSGLSPRCSRGSPAALTHRCPEGCHSMGALPCPQLPGSMGGLRGQHRGSFGLPGTANTQKSPPPKAKPPDPRPSSFPDTWLQEKVLGTGTERGWQDGHLEGWLGCWRKRKEPNGVLPSPLTPSPVLDEDGPWPAGGQKQRLHQPSTSCEALLPGIVLSFSLKEIHCHRIKWA